MIKLTKSSGNVFKDLGFRPEEAEVMRLRSALIAELRRHVREHYDTQAQAAIDLKMTPARVSALMSGKFADFRIDNLVQLAIRAGLSVRLKIAA
ncbi:MAG: XRE family transcriptional regulator [Rudaea sp.]